MEEPWNDASLQAPPINTSLNKLNFDSNILKQTCYNLKNILLNQSPLHKESALCSRFIYKFDKKFRTDIGYRFFKKVNTALHKYLQLNLIKDVETFLSVLPEDQEDYFPTRQMLQYVMVKIISFSKLMKRICICSKQAATFYLDRVKRGESHWMSLMPFALMCRIWSLSLILLQHSLVWYSDLYPCLEKLQLTGVRFLKDETLLPTDLKTYLDIKSFDECGQFTWFSKKNVNITLDFDLNEDVNFDSILDYVKDVNDTSESKLDKNSQSVYDKNDKLENIQLLTTKSIVKNIDEGQSVSRDYFQSFFMDPKDANKIKHTSQVVNKETLEKFINQEEVLRNQSSDLAFTKHLSFMQWQSLKSGLIMLNNSLSKNRKIERKFQKLWKEKCLDLL